MSIKYDVNSGKQLSFADSIYANGLIRTDIVFLWYKVTCYDLKGTEKLKEIKLKL